VADIKFDRDIPVPCRYTPGPVKIDGRLEDAAWQKADNLLFYVPVANETPISKTEARILWDDNYFYVGFKAYDRDIWSYLEDRDSNTCSEDVLEVFFKPYADKEPYFNFEINALGTVYDAYNLVRGAGGQDQHRWRAWDCKGLKTGIFIKGTLNDPAIEDEYWQLEVAVPFASLPLLEGNAPKPGDKWMFHLARYDYSIYLPKGMELSSCTQMSACNFHRWEDWRPLVFEK